MSSPVAIALRAISDGDGGWYRFANLPSGSRSIPASIVILKGSFAIPGRYQRILGGNKQRR